MTKPMEVQEVVVGLPPGTVWAKIRTGRKGKGDVIGRIEEGKHRNKVLLFEGDRPSKKGFALVKITGEYENKVFGTLVTLTWALNTHHGVGKVCSDDLIFSDHKLRMAKQRFDRIRERTRRELQAQHARDVAAHNTKLRQQRRAKPAAGVAKIKPVVKTGGMKAMLNRVKQKRELVTS